MPIWTIIINYKFIDSIANLPRVTKRMIALSFDAFLCVVTVWLAYALRLESFVPLSNVSPWPVLAALGFAIPLLIASGFYRAIFRYSGMAVLQTLARVATLYGLLYATLFAVIGVSGVPRTIGIIQPILLFFGVAISRSLVRQLIAGLMAEKNHKARAPRVLIYGAGSAGRQLALGLQQGHDTQVMGFLDDNHTLHNHHIYGLKVFNPQNLEKLVNASRIDSVLLALPSVSRKRRNDIISDLLKHQINVRTLPGLADLAYGRVTVNDLKELDIADLLGRDVVTPDENLLHKNITGKVVLVTGAGGSIGSEICRQALVLKPAKLILLDHSEFALYTIHAELEAHVPTSEGERLVPVLASVCDEARISEVMAIFKPDTVYHAAAYKHVPLVEANPIEGIHNNVFGTLTIAKVAINTCVSNFVMISTDKAVRPTSVMGATKRLAEMVIQSLAQKQHTTCFCMVRFGNVLGSSGSVIPRFRQQILTGGPITLTHPDITRYFMTIPEAVQLVIQAGAMAKGGEVFLLDMGEPVRIYELAQRMVQLFGLTPKTALHPDGDIEIKITGLRPGEKLYEELLIEDSSINSCHPQIMVALEPFLSRVEDSEDFKSLIHKGSKSCTSILWGLINTESILMKRSA